MTDLDSKETTEQYKSEKRFSLPYTPDFEFVQTEDRALEVAQELSKFKVLAVDTETTGLDPFTSKLLLIQVATADKCYILNCVRVNPSVWSDLLSNENVLKIFQNAVFDYKFLKVHAGISCTPIFDTMLAERLITVGLQRKTSLQYMAMKYLGIDLDKEIRKDFIGMYKDKFSKAELMYAANDALILHEIYNRQIDILQRDELITVALLEFRTVIPIAEMELNGCYIDVNKWRAFLQVAKKNKDEVEEQIQSILLPVCSQLTIFGGSTINIASQKQLLTHLNKLGIEIEDTKDETLQRVGHHVTELLIKWRGWNKIITSYGEELLGKVSSKTGRLHAKFNQARADTGRMSSNGPNLQQIPKESETINFRSCFMAEPGYKLVTADFSQQELRIVACLSQDSNFISAYRNGEDIHTATAIKIWGGTPEEVKENGKRNVAKTVNFLMCYGGGPYTLALRLGFFKKYEDAGFSTKDSIEKGQKEAEDIINGYFKTYPGLKDYISKAGTFAVNNGYSLTVSGRRRYYRLPSVDDEKYNAKIKAVRRKGANTPVQGSAADVSKQALCNFYYALEKGGYNARIIMIVHDEIVCEVKEDQAEDVAKLLEESMIKGFSDFFKDVPMEADACIDTYWHH